MKFMNKEKIKRIIPLFLRCCLITEVKNTKMKKFGVFIFLDLNFLLN
jgi:hypothetical protein